MIRSIVVRCVTLALLALLAPLALVACQEPVGRDDSAFYAWDGRHMHCAIDIDTVANNSVASIETGLDRARDRGEVLELYSHVPGTTVPPFGRGVGASGAGVARDATLRPFGRGVGASGAGVALPAAAPG